MILSISYKDHGFRICVTKLQTCNSVFEPYNQMIDPEDETHGYISGENVQSLYEENAFLAEAIQKESKSKVTPRINWPKRDVKSMSK
jgi:hypothetical protein